MNWSDYSRFVGDIFGAPLAIEAPARLLPRVHLPRPVDLRLGPAAPTAAPGHASGSPRSAPSCRRTSSSPPTRACSTPSATRINPRHRPRRAHRLRRRAHQQRRPGHLPAHHRRRFLVAGAFMRRRRAWHASRKRDSPTTGACRSHAASSAPGSSLVAGARRRRHRRHPGQDHDRAAADEDGRRRGALRRPRSPRPFSILTIGTPRRQPRGLRASRSRTCCRFLAHRHDPDGTVAGHQRPAGPVRPRSTARATTRPIIPVTYWGFRLMIGFGVARRRRSPCVVLWATRKGRTPSGRWLLRGWPRRAAAAARSPTPSAGSSPRWAASPGSSSALMRTPTASRRTRRRWHRGRSPR